jgi:hypothetical protein
VRKTGRQSSSARIITRSTATGSSSIPCSPAWSCTRDYRWSSHRAHAFGEAAALVADHPPLSDRAAGRARKISYAPYAMAKNASHLRR